ncbi:flagellar biosynthetic protein FliO [Colwellia sp. E2M01]|uniref:flagellar biosynthetic protein FliO n=1 Tax=Colwellia sp. E2M01 TaxID=2841561 RepID=UPI002090B49B|nr:flagellar biosynthetic protein FliO [Colwellia sp. E2M01]
MIKKTLGILFACNCYLLPLMAIAVTDIADTDNSAHPNVNHANATVNASGSIADKTLEKITIDTPTKALFDNTATGQSKQTPVKNALSKETLPEEKVTTTIESPPTTPKNTVTEQPAPQVGKHVMANMNPGSMILSLFMVLGLIIVCALILKRFNLTQQSVNQLKVVTTLRLGTKERVLVVQVGEQQLLLGITGQQITLLDKLAEPLKTQADNNVALPKNILSFLSSKKL